MTRAVSDLWSTSRAANRNGLIRDALQILLNLDHRGAVGADPLVGDGAGCLIQTPDRLLRDWAEQERSEPAAARPLRSRHVLSCRRTSRARDFAIRRFGHFVKVEGQILLGWRDVPTDTTGLGQTVLKQMPVIRQAIVVRGARTKDQDAFERKLLSIRKQIQNPLAELAKKHRLPQLTDFYIPSFSTRTVVYKGLSARAAGRKLLLRPAQSADRIRAGAGASAFLDEHLSVLAAGASLPFHRP